jgi:homoserine kinase type II
MKNVFLLEHLNTLPDGTEDVKTIGVYSSKQTALDAIHRLKGQPGFKDAPELRDPLHEDQSDGFYLDEYRVDADHWAEGHVTVS